MEEERALCEAAFRGEHASFVELVRTFRSKALTIAFRLLRDREAARDLVQEAFLRAYTHRDRYDPTRPFGPWFYRIVTHLCLNERKRKRPLPRSEVDRADPRGDPSRVAQARDRSRRLQQAVDRLEERYRLPFILRYVERNSCRDVAAILRCPVNTVKIRLHRARELLRRSLAATPYGKERGA